MNKTCQDCLSRAAINLPDCLCQSILEKEQITTSDYYSEDEGFNPDDFEILYKVEKAHFWFQHRNTIINWAVQRFCTPSQNDLFLEIGCGTGCVLESVSQQFPYIKILGSEISAQGLKLARKRLLSTPLFKLDARKIPFDQAFDIIGMFDVLEHIKEDTTVLRQVLGALKPGGKLLLTVPQHQWLWSMSDVEAHHVRRYSNKELITKLRDAGFSVVHSTSFVSVLLPAMLLSRYMQKKHRSQNEIIIPKWLNKFLLLALCTESPFIRAGLNLPVGGSRLIIAEKNA